MFLPPLSTPPGGWKCSGTERERWRERERDREGEIEMGGERDNGMDREGERDRMIGLEEEGGSLTGRFEGVCE